MAAPKDIKIDHYDYELPDCRIARHPLEARSHCKLLFRASDGLIQDRIFKELPQILPPDSVLVYNNTRVINARLKFRKTSGAQIEIFCLEPFSPSDYERSFSERESCSWSCLVGNQKRWKNGPLSLELTGGDGIKCVLTAEKLDEIGPDGSRIVRFSWTGGLSFSEIISLVGEIPIPPYLNRQSESTDCEDYQTVYSLVEGSVAAPTAGLHFTDELLDEIDKSGIIREEVTLHVGAGTFRPVKSENIGGHDMHSEFISVSRKFIGRLKDYIKSGRKIIAVGTTSVRTLESLFHIACAIKEDRWTGELSQWEVYEEKNNFTSPSEALEVLEKYLEREGMDYFHAYTKIIIAPGYTYCVVDGMITNFHQPKSTLLLLVSAFIGDSWKEIYAHALQNDYRFLSYGDACLFLKSEKTSKLCE